MSVIAGIAAGCFAFEAYGAACSAGLVIAMIYNMHSIVPSTLCSFHPFARALSN